MILTNGKNHANPGLVFERYLRIWYQTRNGLQLNPEFGERDQGDPGKGDDLQAFCDAYEKTGREGKGIVATTHRRLDALLSRGPSDAGAARTYTTRWRIVTGLGGDHPLGNSFVFDRASGAPFLPGSGVKGLCRAAAETVLGMDAQEQQDLFGVDPELGGNIKASEAAGRLVFLPAYPAKDHWPTLEVDVVNNHHPTYYRGLSADRSSAKTQGPRETDSPIPVFFLTVAARTPFTFRICERDVDAGEALIHRAFECLEAGLDYLGFGAKTAAGYGTFEVE